MIILPKHTPQKWRKNFYRWLLYYSTIFLVDKDNDLEEEIIHLFNEVSIFIFNFEKENTTNEALNTLKACPIIRGNFQRFQHSHKKRKDSLERRAVFS